jgi:K+-transporting ATPase ATPase C chain
MTLLLQSFRLLAVLSAVTGVLYPLAVWAVGRVAFRAEADGSLVMREGRVVGSRLLAQRTDASGYFWPRPSAADFATLPSGASNAAWTSATLATAIAARRATQGGGDVPADLLTASGSGLDPDLSPAAARWQAARVAAARALLRERVDALIAAHTAGGRLAPQRVNVLELNLALDALK